MKARIISLLFMAGWTVLFSGLAGTTTAAPAATSPSTIIMKSPSLFVVGDREVAITDLLPALKKEKIPADSPLIIEVPSNTPMNIIKDLTQRLATAGYKPVYKGQRHADATVQGTQRVPLSPVKKQKRQQSL